MGIILSDRSTIVKMSVSKTLSANNTAANVNLFQLTGGIRVKQLSAVLTAKTTLANMTDVNFNLYDSTSAVAITKLTTLTTSTAVVGSVIAKTAIVATVAGYSTTAAGAVFEGTTPFLDFMFAALQKIGANTYIRFGYTTTDAPIACTWKFFIEYESIDGGYLTIV